MLESLMTSIMTISLAETNHLPSKIIKIGSDHASKCHRQSDTFISHSPISNFQSGNFEKKSFDQPTNYLETMKPRSILVQQCDWLSKHKNGSHL